MANTRVPDDVRIAIGVMAGGGMEDGDIVAQTGLSLSSVKRFRLAAGVRHGSAAPQFYPSDVQLCELRDNSNRAMQRKYGTSASVWKRIREEKGIARFRAPTTGPDRSPPTPKAKPASINAIGPYQSVFSKPVADHSVAGEAARFLRTERWPVTNRQKVYGKSGWDVGRMRLTTAEMLEMACRKGFVVQPWMTR